MELRLKFKDEKGIVITFLGIIVVTFSIFYLFYLITQPLYKVYNPNTSEWEMGGELCWNYYQDGNNLLEEVETYSEADFQCDGVNKTSGKSLETKFLRWKAEP